MTPRHPWLRGDCRNPSCYRPGNPLCWVCWNSLTPGQRAQLDAAERDGLVELLGTALAMGREMAESR